MKTITLICCIVLIFPTVFGQKKGFNVVYEEKIVGKNYVNDSDIKGEEILFPNIIHNVFPDSALHYLTFQLKGRKKSGTILQYDLMNKKVLWTKAIDYETSELLKFDKLLILNEYNEAYVIDEHTGDNLSKALNYIYLANPEYNIGMAYLYIAAGDGHYTNDFMGIDVMANKLIWKRNINRGYGWNDFFYLNDSTLLVVASGLHAINVKNGTGWDYHAITGENINYHDAGAVVASVLFGIIGGVFVGIIGGMVAGSFAGYHTRGYYYISIYYPATATGEEIIHDVVSNTLIDSAFIYFAGREEMVKIDKYSGEVVWKYPFPNNLTSTSSIFMDDSVVYMINKGFAFKCNRQVHYGKPFIAAFNKQTGKQKYLSILNKNNDPVIDFKKRDNKIYLLFQHHIAQYNLETGTQILEKKLPLKADHNLVSFVGNETFIFNKDGYLLNLVQNDSTKIYVNTTQTQILSLDHQCNITNTMETNDTGLSFLRYNDYQFIAKGEKTFIINNNGKLIAETAISTNAFIMDNILYDKREKSLIAIDLKHALP